ncbi:transposase, partial [Lactobacillus helveticus]|uniref:transposase n=1 Tax=Lactobacillus helveticus TaxID=1587 RepID=UPI00355C07AD
MKTALMQTYPKAHFQRCLVHVMRNICAKVRVEDREAIITSLSKFINSLNKQEGITVLHSFYSKWQKAYKHVIQNVKDLEADLLVFITIRNRSEV